MLNFSPKETASKTGPKAVRSKQIAAGFEKSGAREQTGANLPYQQNHHDHETGKQNRCELVLPGTILFSHQITIKEYLLRIKNISEPLNYTDYGPYCHSAAGRNFLARGGRGGCFWL